MHEIGGLPLHGVVQHHDWGGYVSIRKLFANLASSPEIKRARQDAICEWLTAPSDWIRVSGAADSIEPRRWVRF